VKREYASPGHEALVGVSLILFPSFVSDLSAHTFWINRITARSPVQFKSFKEPANLAITWRTRLCSNLPRALTNHGIHRDPLSLKGLKMLGNNLVPKPQYAEEATDHVWRKRPPRRYFYSQVFFCSQAGPLWVWEKVHAPRSVPTRRNHTCFDEEAFEVPPQA
jgi:hypothetical protein